MARLACAMLALMAGVLPAAASDEVCELIEDRAGLAQFGRLIGKWSIGQSVLQQDGSWKPVDGAEWTFECALGGHAIQDFWVQPPRSDASVDDAQRQFGTNLRIYDTAGDTWTVVWASSDSSRVTRYQAKADEAGNLVMTGVDPERQGVTQRITYFDIAADAWSWKLEFSRGDNGWLEVARIEARRID